MRELAALALKTLRDLLNDPFTPPALRLKAALAVLQRPHAPNPGWHLPVEVVQADSLPKACQHCLGRCLCGTISRLSVM